MSLDSERHQFDLMLPGLLAGGEAGRYALVDADGGVELFDTHRSARIRGYERFGVDVDLFIERVSDPAVLNERLVVATLVAKPAGL